MNFRRMSSHRASSCIKSRFRDDNNRDGIRGMKVKKGNRFIGYSYLSEDSVRNGATKERSGSGKANISANPIWTNSFCLLYKSLKPLQIRHR